jgi:transcriptional regulator of acetoin/glycerol metabolism
MNAGPPLDTVDECDADDQDPSPPSPGLLLVWNANRPCCIPLPLVDEALSLGRPRLHDLGVDDERVSRLHAQVQLRGGLWTIRDHRSRNGSWVDGQPVQEQVTLASPRTLRIGRSILLFTSDLSSRGAVEVSGAPPVVAGHALHAAWGSVARAARYGDTLLLSGATGTGKEIAARVFHASGPFPGGPFVAINCAAVPGGLAESLFFGCRRGAFSGAHADQVGYVAAANNGTLFLDELGELDLDVQAKLLRVLEAREVLPVGATRPRAVNVRVCSATHVGLREKVARGEFREDLYFRIGRPEIALPSLHDRAEEIPWIVQLELSRAGNAAAHPGLIEACLLRPWPGNVRELRAEMRRIARDPSPSSGGPLGKDLLGEAGLELVRASRAEPRPPPGRDEIEEALRRSGGNVSAAARSLGSHRTQLRRWLERYEIHTEEFRPLVPSSEPKLDG